MVSDLKGQIVEDIFNRARFVRIGIEITGIEDICGGKNNHIKRNITTVFDLDLFQAINRSDSLT